MYYAFIKKMSIKMNEESKLKFTKKTKKKKLLLNNSHFPK